MNSLPKVSLVVPAYNAEKYIGEALESILIQDHPDFDVIVVDDGSTDRTSDVAASFGNRIKLHRQKNAGQSSAMATGWRMAEGEIIGYLSADDTLLPRAITIGAEELAANPDVVLVYPDFDIIDERSKRQSSVHPPDFSRRALYAELHCLPGPGALFKRSAYEKAGPWRADFRQIPDLDFFLRMGLQGDFLHIPEVLAQFRMHAESTTYRPVPFERGEEPLRMIDTFFLRSDLPAEIQSWEKNGRANAYLLSSAIHGRAGRVTIAARRLARALALQPSLLASRKTLGHVLLITQHARASTRSTNS